MKNMYIVKTDKQKHKNNTMKKVITLALCLLFAVGITAKVHHKNVQKKSFGVDISQYNGNVNFKKLKPKTKFVVVRATTGKKMDVKFKKNFASAKKHGLLVGAYHYYRPSENPKVQAANYIKAVKLHKGNIRPVVDIEQKSKKISTKAMKNNFKIFLARIEHHYGVKPIIYSGYDFYDQYLDRDFKKYPYWIAAYSKKKAATPIVKKAVIHQFTDKAKLRGNKCKFDGNKGDIAQMTIR